VSTTSPIGIGLIGCGTVGQGVLRLLEEQGGWYAQRLGRILRPTDERQPARLYEIIATDTMENYVSQRRREGVEAEA
jgi:homoserine dehydrogenase